MTPVSFCVLLFRSVSQTLLAEKILKREELPHKVIPVPRQISSDCGVCIRFDPKDRERIAAALDGKVDVQKVCPI
jgi:hypothetical protein